MLAEELEEDARDAGVFITHLKPGERAFTMKEVSEAAGRWRPRMLENNQEFEALLRRERRNGRTNFIAGATMSALLEPKMPSGNVADMSVKLAFSKKIQAVTNRIHSTNNIDEIILDVSRDICQLFEADRMTVYTVSEDLSSIVSKVKTGLNSFKDIKLPISESSLAGFAALNKRHMNIKDVYDDAELKTYSPNLAFLKAVDQRTGYRSKQMLIAPILGGETGTDLMGVIQLINNLAGQPFSSLHDEG